MIVSLIYFIGTGCSQVPNLSHLFSGVLIGTFDLSDFNFLDNPLSA